MEVAPQHITSRPPPSVSPSSPIWRWILRAAAFHFHRKIDEAAQGNPGGLKRFRDQDQTMNEKNMSYTAAHARHQNVAWVLSIGELPWL